MTLNPFVSSFTKMCHSKYRDLSEESIEPLLVVPLGPEVFVEIIMEDHPYVEIGE